MTRRGIERDQGASLVEIAIIVPVLLLLAIGLSEIGFLVVDYVTVTNSARSGARAGSTLANSDGADDEILQIVEEDVCNLRFGDLTRVIIFKADAAGDIPTDPAEFRVYEPTGALLCNTPGHSLALKSGTWAPGDRDNVPPSLDRLGVQVEFTHSKVTNLVPFDTIDLKEKAVMQLEPDTRGG